MMNPPAPTALGRSVTGRPGFPWWSGAPRPDQAWRCNRSPWGPRFAMSSTRPATAPNQCGGDLRPRIQLLPALSGADAPGTGSAVRRRSRCAGRHPVDRGACGLSVLERPRPCNSVSHAAGCARRPGPSRPDGGRSGAANSLPGDAGPGREARHVTRQRPERRTALRLTGSAFGAHSPRMQ